MRKLLLATSALVAFAGAAQAAESPLAVTVGGSVDFRAALFHESSSVAAQNTRNSGDFETVYQVDIAATGKANGVEYGAKIGLWNGENTRTNGAVDDGSNVQERDAYVWLSGKFGKAIFGDAHTASEDLFVYAPTVGEGQIDGSYTDFVSATSLAPITPAYLPTDTNDTNVTFYTPKVGNADHKVQLGVSFTPELAQKGHKVSVVGNAAPAADYKNVTGIALQYTGKLGPVAAVVAANSNIGTANNGMTAALRDFTTYGGGAQLTYAGVTVGGSYVNAGRYNTATTEKKPQDVWTFGAKYGFDKVEVAANILDGRGYLGGTGTSYVRDIQELGLGATYNWFPGMTTAADAVFFRQTRDNDLLTHHNTGHVLMLSQKLAF